MAASSAKRRVFAGVGANVLGKLVVSATQLLSVSILSIQWGLHLYSLWVLLSTIPTFLAMGDFGFATAAGVKMTMARARGEEQAVVAIFQSAWLAITLSSVVLVIGCVAVSLLVPVALFGSDPGIAEAPLRMTVLLLLLYGVAVIQGGIFFAALRCDGQFALGSLWNAVVMLVESAGLLVVVWCGGGLVWAAAALLTGRLLGLAGQRLLLRRRMPWLKLSFSHATRAEVRALGKPAVAAMVLPLAQALALQGSAIVLAIAAGPAVVPAFTAARTLSRIGLQVCWLFNSALMPEVSAAVARDNRAALAMMVLATIAVSAALVLPFAGCYGLFGSQAVALWTGGVIEASGALMAIMAVSVVAGGFWFPLSNLILAANRHGSYTPAYALLALASLPATYLLGVRFGSSGAAMAMAALDVAMLGIVLVLARRILVGPREVLGAIPQALRYFIHFARGARPRASL